MDEGQSVVEMASQLEGLMDDNGDFLEEVAESPQEGVGEDHVEDFEEEDPEEDSEEEDSEEEDSEEEDPEEDPEEEDSEEEDPEEDSEEETLYEIVIGDEVFEVNLEELQSGYLRNEDLVRRQTELEEEYQERVDTLEDERAELLSQLSSLSLQNDVGLQKFQNINWERLKQENPEAYREAVVEYTEAQHHAQAIKTRQRELQVLHQKAQELKQEAYLKSQREVATRLIPELANEETREKFSTDLVNYGKTIGYTEDEIHSISDAKSLFVLNQARLYALSQVKRKEAQAKVSKDLPQIVKPGAPKTKGQEQTNHEKALRSKFKASHDIRDAAALLANYL